MGATKGGGHGGQHHQQGAAGGKHGRQGMHEFERARMALGEVDAGDAAPEFKDMRLHVGYGVGARIKTPAGPLFLDVAYGQRDRKLRWHFSLGMAF